MSGRETIYNFEHSLTVKPRGFSVRFEGGLRLGFLSDGGRLTRAHLLNYTVEGDTATRSAPIAATPQDFLDEWTALPWDEAVRWIDPARRDALRDWHARLREAVHEASTVDATLISTRRCASTAGWEIAVGFASSGDEVGGGEERPAGEKPGAGAGNAAGEKPGAGAGYAAGETAGAGAGQAVGGAGRIAEAAKPSLPERLYLTVVKRGAAFRLQGIDTVQEKGCRPAGKAKPR